MPGGAAEKAQKGTLYDKFAAGVLGAGSREVFPGTQESPNTARRDAQDGPQTPRAPPDAQKELH